METDGERQPASHLVAEAYNFEPQWVDGMTTKVGQVFL